MCRASSGMAVLMAVAVGVTAAFPQRVPGERSMPEVPPPAEAAFIEHGPDGMRIALLKLAHDEVEYLTPAEDQIANLVWSADGKLLFFRRGTTLLAVNPVT